MKIANLKIRHKKYRHISEVDDNQTIETLDGETWLLKNCEILSRRRNERRNKIYKIIS